MPVTQNVVPLSLYRPKSIMTESSHELFTVGWREWVSLPDLNIDKIKVKVDTGARTSALHATDLEPFEENGKQRIAFTVHPHQRDYETVVRSVADILDQRSVTNSGGQSEHRWTIQTDIVIGTSRWPIAVTLTARHDMRFRMLLGRNAMENRVCVNPAESFVWGRKRLKQRRQ